MVVLRLSINGRRKWHNNWDKLKLGLQRRKRREVDCSSVGNARCCSKDQIRGH